MAARAWWCTQRQTARGPLPRPWTFPLGLARTTWSATAYTITTSTWWNIRTEEETRTPTCCWSRGERPDGDNTLFDTASTAGILSVVRLRISNDGVRVISHTSWRSISRGRLQEDGHHCLQCPRITVGKTLVDGRLSAPTSTAAEPPQKKRSAARLRLRWSALPCGRTFRATA